MDADNVGCRPTQTQGDLDWKWKQDLVQEPEVKASEPGITVCTTVSSTVSTAVQMQDDKILFGSYEEELHEDLKIYEDSAAHDGRSGE